MTGLGTIINTAGILAGGAAGYLFGSRFNSRIQEALTAACGVSVLFIGIAGAMEGMLQLQDGALTSGQSMLVVLSLALGALIGEWINIEGLFERFGSWLKVKTGNARDKKFVDAFVTSSLTVSIQDGIYGDFSVLATKAILDLIIVLVMTCSLGIGCIFSAIPVAVFEGLLTFLARFLRPVMTEAALANLSLVGSILIFCVGLNLLWEKKVRVANLLPSVVLAVAAAFLPVG